MDIIIYFPEVLQDPSNYGTDKIGVDYAPSADVSLSVPGGEMHTIEQILTNNDHMLAYGAQSVELITAQTTVSMVNPNYLVESNQALLDSRLGPVESYVWMEDGSKIPVAPFQGTREEFDKITSGFDIQTSLDTVLVATGPDNVYSGTIVLPGESGGDLGRGIDLLEITQGTSSMSIQSAYENQLAAAREWSAEEEPSYSPEQGYGNQMSVSAFKP